jgi:hypothetical protein
MYWAHLGTVNCRPFPFIGTDSRELEPLQRRRISVPKETSRWLIRPWFLMLLVIRYHLHVKNIYILSIIIQYYAILCNHVPGFVSLKKNHQPVVMSGVGLSSGRYGTQGKLHWSDEDAVSETTMTIVLLYAVL